MTADLIRARKADIFWDEERVGVASARVLVTNIDDRLAKADLTGLDPAVRYDNTYGAGTEDWLTETDLPALLEGLFAAHWLHGPSSQEAIKAGLREFAKIQECGWARAMYAAIENLNAEASTHPIARPSNNKEIGVP